VAGARATRKAAEPKESAVPETSRTDRSKAAHEKLQQAVRSIATGEDWQRMLRTAAKFHRYSFHNQLSIFLQRPDATAVAGFNRWKSLGRFVKKGEKGIAAGARLLALVRLVAQSVPELLSPAHHNHLLSKSPSRSPFLLAFVRHTWATPWST
jgi:hypothetical protein